MRPQLHRIALRAALRAPSQARRACAAPAGPALLRPFSTASSSTPTPSWRGSALLSGDPEPETTYEKMREAVEEWDAVVKDYLQDKTGGEGGGDAEAAAEAGGAEQRVYATGRRKRSIAQVWMKPGTGKIIVNREQFQDFFKNAGTRATVLDPFWETGTLGVFDVQATVTGGGYTGQADAIKLGVARALQQWDPELRPLLKKAGLLTRDSRVVEEKKAGKKKARKSKTWVKR